MALKRSDILFDYWAYQFPKLSYEDVKVAQDKYNLKLLYTPAIDITQDTLLMGTWNNILGYIQDYIGTELNNDYIVYLGKDDRRDLFNLQRYIDDEIENIKNSKYANEDECSKNYQRWARSTRLEKVMLLENVKKYIEAILKEE